MTSFINSRRGYAAPVPAGEPPQIPFPLALANLQSPTMTHDNLPASIENLSARIIAIRDSL